jgi:hypothetical protein
MKKALLTIFCIIGCDEAVMEANRLSYNASKKDLYEGMLKKTPTMKDCSIEVIGESPLLYIVRCPLSQTSVMYMNGKRSVNSSLVVEDAVPKEDPELTALKEKAEKLGFEVKKK